MSIEATDEFMRSATTVVSPTIAAADEIDFEAPFPAFERSQTEKLKQLKKVHDPTALEVIQSMIN